MNRLAYVNGGGEADFVESLILKRTHKWNIPIFEESENN